MKVLFILLLLVVATLASTGAATLYSGSADGSGNIDISNYEKIGSSGSLSTGSNTIISNDQGVTIVCISTSMITNCIAPSYPYLLLLDGVNAINTIILTGGVNTIYSTFITNTTVLKLQLSSPGCQTKLINTSLTVDFIVSVF